jgi:hypothetical protein
MLHACVGHGRHNVEDEDLLNVICSNLLSSVHQISSATRLFQSVVWHTLLESQLCSFQVQPLQGLEPGNRHLALLFLQWMLHEDV